MSMMCFGGNNRCLQRAQAFCSHSSVDPLSGPRSGCGHGMVPKFWGRWMAQEPMEDAILTYFWLSRVWERGVDTLPSMSCNPHG